MLRVIFSRIMKSSIEAAARGDTTCPPPQFEPGRTCAPCLQPKERSIQYKEWSWSDWIFLQYSETPFFRHALFLLPVRGLLRTATLFEFILFYIIHSFFFFSFLSFLGLEVRESHSLYIHIYIFWVVASQFYFIFFYLFYFFFFFAHGPFKYG